MLNYRDFRKFIFGNRKDFTLQFLRHKLLQALARIDFRHEAFRFFRCREFQLGMASVRALRVSYVGELGYELHHEIAYQRYLYDLIMTRGQALGIVERKDATYRHGYNVFGK